MEKKIGNSLIKLEKGDITELEVDIIVNAANANLILGGGVAGAIRRKGGPDIQEECNTIGGIFVGGAVITGAGNLKAKYVIHAAGPRKGEGNEEEKLKNATLNSLKLARSKRLESIAFPAISTGIFGYPIDKCARIMLRATREFVLENTTPSLIIFCLFDDKTFKIFEDELAHIA